MPRSLVSAKWNFYTVDEASLEPGDVLFVKKIAEKRLISHVALGLGEGRVFHCKKGRGAIDEHVLDLFKIYEQIILEEQLSYIDSRNKSLRELHKGFYLHSKL